jgi:adenylate kinase family enzyme
MRISIIGLPGSGKTTLANAISEKLSIPHIHLDRFWFEAGGREGSRTTPPDEMEIIRAYIKEKVTPLIAEDSWVSDGFYPRIQTLIAERVDKIVFLDVPLWTRLMNHAPKRV